MDAIFWMLQKINLQGFGERNVKALYDAMEKEQEKRGTLYKEDLWHPDVTASW